MMKLTLRTMTLSAVLLCMVAVWFFATVQQHLDAKVTLPETSLLQPNGRLLWSIEKGDNLSQVNQRLYNEQLIADPNTMTLYARFIGRASIQAGDYWISEHDSARSLLSKFNQGKVVRYQVTFPEGWSFNQWHSHLAKLPQFASIADQHSTQLLKGAGIQLQHPEGWFFPDTYSYSATDSVGDILFRAHQKMRDTLHRAWRQREPDLPYQSPYEALIMASIIEKETGMAEERRAIAGVFVRRLQRNMRLQTDPTVIYGMGDDYQGNIRRHHLKQRTAYNTYMIKGLPPTPIAMPSAASIEAALHPQPGSSLYFVARGDGGHYFSDSIEEHLKAVKQYQVKQRVRNYQSSPK